MIEHQELLAWLGPAYGQMSEEQLARFFREAEAIAERYPDPDGAELREEAMSATVQHLLGEVTLAEAARDLGAIRAREARAEAVAKQLAWMANADGMPEAQAARAAGIDRMTLRKMKRV